jgi:hypothetical protein
MASQDTQPRQGSAERAAQEHDRSADVYEEHAVLMDRFGAHRSARTERSHAEDERDAARAVRAPETPAARATEWYGARTS